MSGLVRRSILSALAGVVAMGCAASSGRPQATSATDCVRVREVDSIGALDDDRHIFVKSGAATFHLLTVSDGCQGIAFANGFSIGDGAARVCADGFSFVSFVHPEQGPMRCRIEWLEPVASKAEAMALIEAREADERAGR